ncbi:hypothetical protein ABDK10_06170 [Staphylococcus aureus]
MKYYNRDNYERNLESYEVPEHFTKGAKNEFVYGFIVGAVIGSAVGLVSLSKSRTTKEQTKSKDESSFKSSIIEQSESEQAEANQQVNRIKSTVVGAQDKDSEATDSELTAQKNAIQQETSSNNLADMSPEAHETQHNQQHADDATSHINPESEPTEKELNAQQVAIQSEASDNNLADPSTSSPNSTGKGAKTAAVAAGGAVAAGSLAKVAHDKKQSLNENRHVAKNTDDLLKSEETSSDETKKDAPDLVTQNSKEANDNSNLKTGAGLVAGTVTASGLALAAKNKSKALSKDTKVAENTANLLKPESPEQGSAKNVPNLVTPKVDNAVESTDKVNNSADKNKTKATPTPEQAEQRVKQTHKTVSFKHGIIVHDEAENGINKQATSNNQQNVATTDSQQTKKTNSFEDGILVHDESERKGNDQVSNSSSQQTKKTNSFDDGILVHDESERKDKDQVSRSSSQQNRTTSNEPTYSKNRSQLKKSEKAESKIDKRTFND